MIKELILRPSSVRQSWPSWVSRLIFPRLSTLRQKVRGKSEPDNRETLLNLLELMLRQTCQTPASCTVFYNSLYN